MVSRLSSSSSWGYSLSNYRQGSLDFFIYRGSWGRVVVSPVPIRVSRLSCRLIKLSAFVKGVLLLVASGFAGVPPATERSVLVLYSERGDLPAIEAVEDNIRQVLHASTSPRIE